MCTASQCRILQMALYLRVRIFYKWAVSAEGIIVVGRGWDAG
jgi:hypothetical protein